MDVDHAIGEGTEEVALENPHEAGEHDHINLRLDQPLHERLLRLLVELRPKLSRCDEFGEELPFTSAVQDAGIRHVADDDGDLRRDLTAGTRLGDGHHIRAFARTEDAESKGLRTIHGDLILAAAPGSQAESRRDGRMTNDAMPPMTDDQHSESNSRATLSLVIGYHTTQLASAAGIRFTPPMFRKDLIPLLLDNPLSVAQIARLVREEPRDIEADLLHLLKSLKLRIPYA